MRKQVRVTIVIPCFNHGHFIHEAIASVEQCETNDYELIIVNDGSTDPFTQQVVRELESAGYCVISQQNQGLAAARNAAIRIAKGDYILPLDADNRIRKNYLEGMKILDDNPEISVVYGKPSYFGESLDICLPVVADFDLLRLLDGNFIDACALFRKSMWQDCGGYDVSLPPGGLEDWDLWLSAVARGHKFCFMDEFTFDYRVRSDSMIRNLTRDHKAHDMVMNYLLQKHSLLQVYHASDSLRSRVAQLDARVRSLEILELKLQRNVAFKVYHRLKYLMRPVG